MTNIVNNNEENKPPKITASNLDIKSLRDKISSLIDEPKSILIPLLNTSLSNNK